MRKLLELGQHRLRRAEECGRDANLFGLGKLRRKMMADAIANKVHSSSGKESRCYSIQNALGPIIASRSRLCRTILTTVTLSGNAGRQR